jgi:hypothetical protein
MKRLIAPTALAPLLLSTLPAAQAETALSGSVTSPVATATANGGAPDDVHIASGASVVLSSGAAVTLNSSNSIDNEGAITLQNADNITGIAAVGGLKGSITSSGSITVNDTDVPTDSDGDGDLDGPFANGSGRFGIRVQGTAPLDGAVTSSGTVTVKGNDSAGLALDAGITGSLTSSGAISVLGDRSFGIHAAGPIGGSVSITGTVSAQGGDAVGIALDQGAVGAVTIDSTVSATGYRITTRSTDASVLAKMDADDDLLGGPALRIQGSVGAGVLVDSSGTVASYGSAPALLIGGSSPLTVGAVGSGDDAYGLVIRNNVQGEGIYDGFSATAIQVGGAGGTAGLAGGIRISGTAEATSYAADATGLRVGAGGIVPELRVEGSLAATSNSTGAVAVEALRIEGGGTLSTLTNSGSIAATVAAPAGTPTTADGNATAVRDLSGALTSIQNSGTITAKITRADAADTATGRTIALDLRANTAGVMLTQTGGAAAITGDVLFGSGAATVNLLGGSLTGALAFGTGADSLVIDNGATVTGALTNADGRLDVTVANGRLTLSNADSVTLTSLQVGSGGTLVFSADPSAGHAGQLLVSGATTLASGAKIDLLLRSKLTQAASYTLISSPSLSAGAVGSDLLGAVSYFYQADLATDAGAGTVTMNVRRRTAAEAGIGAGAPAFDAVFDAFDRDAGVRDALLATTTRSGFKALYSEMLPDYAGATLQTLAAGMGQVTSAQALQPLMLKTAGTVRPWVQAIGFRLDRDPGAAPGYRSGGFGMAGGFETAGGTLGTLGLSLSYLIGVIKDPDAAPGSRIVASSVTPGLYWRYALGGLRADASVNGGYAWFTGSRTFAGTDFDGGAVERKADSHWGGAVANGHAGFGYEAGLGALFVRPEASADYLLLREGSHREHGGGEAFDLIVSGRSSHQASAQAGATVGAEFHGGFAWRPELSVAWKEILGSAGDTTARFRSGGGAFTLSPTPLDKGGLQGKLALHAGNAYSDIAFEAEAERRGDFHSYGGRFTARFRF